MGKYILYSNLPTSSQAHTLYAAQQLMHLAINLLNEKSIEADAIRLMFPLNAAGMNLGDSVAPLVGGVLYDLAGVRASNGSQVAVCIPAVACAALAVFMAGPAVASLLPSWCLGQANSVAQQHRKDESTKDFKHTNAAKWSGEATEISGNGDCINHAPLCNIVVDQRAATPDQQQNNPALVKAGSISAISAPCAAPTPVFSARMVFKQMQDWFVVSECGLVFTSQALRQLVS